QPAPTGRARKRRDEDKKRREMQRIEEPPVAVYGVQGELKADKREDEHLQRLRAAPKRCKTADEQCDPTDHRQKPDRAQAGRERRGKIDARHVVVIGFQAWDGSDEGLTDEGGLALEE